MGSIGKRKMKREKKLSIGRLSMRVFIPVLILLAGIILVMFQSMLEARTLAYRYIEDTARLYVEQISTDMTRINYEVISQLNRNERTYSAIEDIRPDSSRYYSLIGSIQEELGSLKIRYSMTTNFYLALEEKDVVILDSGTIFPSSRLEGKNLALVNALRGKRGSSNAPFSQWDFMSDGEQTYVYSRYSRNGITMGCVISLDTLLSNLRVNSLGYEGIPYIVKRDGTLLISEPDREKVPENIATWAENPPMNLLGSKNLYSFPINGIMSGGNSFYIFVASGSGVLDRILALQAAVVVLAMGIILGGAVVIRIYYYNVLRPMKQFVTSLKNMEEEQSINENGQNNLLELEMASVEFRNLLRKIQALKIDIYEKELSRQKTELEALQERIKPHFYLNCLSLIHGMADVDREEEIVRITEQLSFYMRYVMQEAFEPVPLEEEVKFVRNYVDIQQLRYGSEAFSFEAIIDQGAEEYLIPTLAVHNFVENAVNHAMSLDNKIEISLYAALETYEDGKYLYLCISDTGKGFPGDVLESLRQEKAIIYDGREHIGISNTVKRLKILYGERARVAFSNMDEGYGAVVEITIPAVRGSDQEA